MPETVTLPGRPDMVAIARAAVRALLAGYPCLDDAELIACEFCTNSVRHSKSGQAGASFQVSVDAKPGYVRIEVTDDGPRHGFHQLAPAGELDEYGRGLEIVDNLATRWGHDCGAGYATRWAELIYQA